MMSNSGLQQLKSLQTKLNQLIDTASNSDVSFPALDEVRSIDDPLERQNPQLAAITATLGQMSAVVGGHRHVLMTALQFHVSSSLRIAVEAHVEEALREAGKPLAAQEIAKASCIDADKLARVLRLLAANYIFVETEPGVFARNQCSSFLDTGKSVQALRDDPDNAYAETNGFAALIAHTTDDVLKASARAPDVLLDPKLGLSYAPEDAPFAAAFGGVTPFVYFAQNAPLMNRFGMAMGGMQKACSAPESSNTGFPFRDLPENDVVVDVGGGVGHLCLAIGSEAPHLKFVVQDREEVAKSAPEVWKKAASSELLARTTFQGYDFFQPQPVKDASVFLLRAIIHDWPDKEATQILQNLKNAATPKTKLVIIESALEPLSAPSPFPPANSLPYYLDLQMMCALNAQERTEAQYRALGEKAGWKLVKTWKTGEGGQDGPFRHYEFHVV